jgi:hypothetical protein
MRTVWASNSVLAAADLVALINGLDSTAALRSYLGQAGDEVITRGALVLGDGGGGAFRWDAANTGADDGVFTILPAAEGGPGRWVRVVQGDVYNVAWWAPDRTGAAASDTAVQAADAAASAAGVGLLFPSGTYRLAQSYAFLSPLEFSVGALLRPLAGVTLTLAETPAASFARPIFDLSASGVVRVARPTGPLCPSWWGAAGTAVSMAANLVITSGHNVLISTTPLWTRANVGNKIVVATAGNPMAANTELQSTITAVSPDGTTIDLQDNAGATVSASGPTQVSWGNDDTAAVAAAMNAGAGSASEVLFAPGNYLVDAAQQTFAGAHIAVRASGHAKIVRINGPTPITVPVWSFTGAGCTVEGVEFRSTDDVTLPSIVTAIVGVEEIVGRNITAAGPVTMGAGDSYVVLKKTIDEATVVNLPAFPRLWRRQTVKHASGNAVTNPVTLTPPAGILIDGFTSLTLNITGFSVDVMFDGAGFNIVQVTDGGDWASQ